jgi:uncharacterized protein involved in type VI secretion and phage assembly
VVLGSLYSSKQATPYELEAPNDTKAIVTRCGHKLVFDEADRIITVVTPAGNTIVLSDKDKSIVLQDQSGNKVELAPGGITLDSPKDIVLKAKGKVTVEAGMSMALKAAADLTVDGANVACSAQMGFSAKGNASAELSATGQTVVKGAMVLIN